MWHFMVIYRLIYPPIALKFVNSVLWKYLTPLKIPEEVLKRPEDSWRSQKIERVLQDWQQERPQGKPHRAPLFNPVFAFEQAHNKPHFYEEKNINLNFLKRKLSLNWKWIWINFMEAGARWDKHLNRCRIKEVLNTGN